MPASIAELANRLNLSKGTVSRILNHKGEAFAPETRKRVFALADEIGYRPNPVARALATGRTGCMGLWVYDLLTSHHAHVAHQMEAQLERCGYQVFITLYGKSQENPRDNTPAAFPVVADGIIAHEVSGENWPALFGHLEGRIPIVATGAWAAQETVDYVGVDLFPASRAAIQHFVTLGRKRIAYVTTFPQHRRGDGRYEAYVGVLRDSGIAPEFIETRSGDRATVRRTFRDYVAAHGCPDGIFCHNDDAAIAVYRALCDMGRSVPEEVALIGCDGIEDTEYFPVPIATIAQPLGAMCETASRFLERRLNEPDIPAQRTIFEAELLLRASSAP
jgi:LacI family transcriptional regulator